MGKRRGSGRDRPTPDGTSAPGADRLDPALRDEVVAFLREWLPASAARAYRRMIAADPVDWSAHPHFQGGIIVEHALRGNGITEEVLGVESLEAIWPELLRLAVQVPDPGEAEGGP
jgi:hypothetical protein